MELLHQIDYKPVSISAGYTDRILDINLDNKEISIRELPPDFKDKYIEILKQDNLFNEKEIEDFLCGNALNFLGLLPGNKNRQRLEKFYIDNEIEPPEWFKSTEELDSI